MRLGLYGGTFDPIHFGHLLLAETCRESASLDEIWFIPNARSPHKQHVSMRQPQHRIQMLQLAIGGHASFRVWTREVDRGGLSFTVETLEEIHASHPDDQLFLLMGADSLVDFPRWKQPQRICQLCTPLVVRRPNSPPPDISLIVDWLDEASREFIQRDPVTMPMIDISSTDLRKRQEQGKSIRYRTPRAVEKYIETQGLYLD